MPSSAKPLRVVVCGAVFGQVYLEAFRLRQYPLELAGILSRGSARAHACAEHYGVPLFTEVDDIPDDVDAACVVVRSRILGGQGTELAQTLIERGLHVLQEHPVHTEEMAGLLRLARSRGVVYRLNSFYVNVGQVRRFLGAARELGRDRKPLYIDAACGCQLSFSLLDIIGHTLGSLRPWEIRVLPHRSGEPFVALQATFAGTPVTLRIQNQLDPADPDGFSFFLHRLSVGWEEGNLTLADTHGPVVWSPRPRFPRQVRAEDSTPQFASSPLDAPRTEVIGPAEAPSLDEVFRHHWPAGVARELLELRRAVQDREDPLLAGRRLLTVCELWQDVSSHIGPPELVHGEPVPLLSAETLSAAERAAEELERMPRDSSSVDTAPEDPNSA